MVSMEQGQMWTEAEAGDEPELTGPLRLCALSRCVLPIDQLIRFGAGPDSIVVPDLARRLPGRGVWLTSTRATVEMAVARKVFAKSLKRNVTAPADLPDRIDALMLKRVTNALSLANKAGLVVSGFAKVDASLEQGSVVGLFHGGDGAADGTDRLNRKYAAISAAHGHETFIATTLTIDQISLAIGKSNVVHVALTSGGAATQLLDETKRLMRYRSHPEAS